MKRDSIGVKLGIAFGFLIALLIGVGWLGLTRIGQINSDMNKFFGERWMKLHEAREASYYSNSTHRIAMVLLLPVERTKAEKASLMAQIVEDVEKGSSAWEKIEEEGGSEKEIELLKNLKAERLAANQSLKQVMGLMADPNKEAEAKAIMMSETLPLLNEYRDSWNVLREFEEGQIDQTWLQNEKMYAAARRVSGMLILMAIALAAGMAFFVTRKLTREMHQREQAQIAVYNLNENLEKKVAQRTEELGLTVETLRDEVSERSAREADLQRLAAIVESSDDAIIALTLDGIITDWNMGAVRMFGFEAAEMIGKPISFLTPTDRRHEPADILLGVSAGNNAIRSETVRLRKDGKLIQVSLTISSIKNTDGKIVGGAAIVRDITERKSIEDALRNSEANFRSMVHNAPYGIMRTTLDGKIVHANPAIVEMLGYASEQEVMSLNVETDVFRYPKDREKVTLGCQEHKAVEGLEVEWRRKNKEFFTARVDVHVVKDPLTNQELLEGFAEDLTEQRAMESQLRQAQKMEAIGRLAGGIAHDFNNLLGVIIGYCELVSEKTGQDHAMQNPVEQIRKAAERASTLTRQLLVFSRQQVLETKVLNLNVIVGEMARMLPRLLGEDIDLQTSLDPGLGPVKADQGQIEQVIMNLAVNARDAMPAGGKLLIGTSNVHLDRGSEIPQRTLLPGEYILLSVTDTGMGMDAQTQAHIFEPFFTTKEQGKGTGLGLATVYGFVEQSGGHVWVNSTPGAGTTFQIYLPRVGEKAAQNFASAAVETSSRGTETILLAEDEESLRTLTRNLLVESGYTVLEAGNGLEAIELADSYRGPIDLLLTDMVMPGMNGKALAEKLTFRYPEVRVVFMSGYTGFSGPGHADLDAVIIPKPFTRDVLLRKLRDTFGVEKKVGRA